MTYKTTHSIGDAVFIPDLSVRAPIGPVRIRGVTIVANGSCQPIVTYHFGQGRCEREENVFDTHDETTTRLSDSKWYDAAVRK